MCLVPCGSCCIHSISLTLQMASVMRYPPQHEKCQLQATRRGEKNEHPQLVNYGQKFLTTESVQPRAKLRLLAANSFLVLCKILDGTHQSLHRVESIAPDANYAHVILAAFRKTAIKVKRRREREKVSENSRKVDIMN